MAQDLDAHLTRTLADELDAHLRQLRQAVAAVVADPTSTSRRTIAGERVHTVTASASLLAYRPLLETSQVLEETLRRLSSSSGSSMLIDSLLPTVDDLEFLVGGLVDLDVVPIEASTRAAAARSRLDTLSVPARAASESSPMLRDVAQAPPSVLSQEFAALDALLAGLDAGAAMSDVGVPALVLPDELFHLGDDAREAAVDQESEAEVIVVAPMPQCPPPLDLARPGDPQPEACATGPQLEALPDDLGAAAHQSEDSLSISVGSESHESAPFTANAGCSVASDIVGHADVQPDAIALAPVATPELPTDCALAPTHVPAHRELSAHGETGDMGTHLEPNDPVAFAPVEQADRIVAGPVSETPPGPIWSEAHADLDLLPFDPATDGAMLDVFRSEAIELLSQAREELERLALAPDDIDAIALLRDGLAAIVSGAELLLLGAVRESARALHGQVADAAARDHAHLRDDKEDWLVALERLRALVDAIGLDRTSTDSLPPSDVSLSLPAKVAGPHDTTDGPNDVPATEEQAASRVVPDAVWEPFEPGLLGSPSDAARTDGQHAWSLEGGGWTSTHHIEADDADDLAATFMQEARELIAEGQTAVGLLADAPADAEAVGRLRRCFHTLAGSAALVGMDALASCARAMEQEADGLLRRGARGSLRSISMLHVGLEQLAALLAQSSLRGQDRAPMTSPGTAAALDAPAGRGLEQLTGETDVLTGDEPVMDDDLRAVFVDEARDILDRVNRNVQALDQNHGDRSALTELRRAAHTLKGAAAATGFPMIAELCHAMEDLLDELFSHSLSLTDQLLATIFSASSELERLVGAAAAGEAAPHDGIQAVLGSLDAAVGLILPTRGELGDRTDADHPLALAPLPSADVPTLQGEQEQTEIDGLLAEDTPSLDRMAPVHDSRNVVRLELPRLDALLGIVGDLVTSRSALEQRIVQLHRALQEFSLTAERLRKLEVTLNKQSEASELTRSDSFLAPSRTTDDGRDTAAEGSQPPDEFDALELDRYTAFHLLSRQVTEAVADLGAVEREVKMLQGAIGTIAHRQSRSTAELQDGLLTARLMRLDGLLGRAYRAGRDLAARQGKQVRLHMSGHDVEIDATVVESLSEILLHLIRNAIDHGVEEPATRRACGKSDVATVVCSASRDGNTVLLEVRDDGAGIDPAQIHAEAVRRGLVPENASLTRQAQLDLVLLHGLSTRETVTEMSGRGVGLDIVLDRVRRSRGSLHVDSQPGTGTTVTIRIPITLAITRAQLVETAGQQFAIPVHAMGELARFPSSTITGEDGARTVRLREHIYPLYDLDRLLGWPRDEATARERVSAVIVETPRGGAAVAVDAFLAQHDIVVKPLPNHLQSLPGITGATIVDDGRVILVLDPAQLVLLVEAETKSETDPMGVLAAVPGTGGRRADSLLLALVVDDSLSIRRIVGKALEADGFRVRQARDGEEALVALEEERPDVLLLDIEMPRMDGFELTSRVRSAASWHDLPIAMLTSRAGERHRAKARELGVQAYLTKPCSDRLLIQTARELVAGTLSRSRA